MLRYVYAVLAIAGMILPMICFGMHFSQRGDPSQAWGEFFAAPFATWVISGFGWDLMFTATASTIWMANESRRLRMRGFVWHFLTIFLFGICFALPSFLYRREQYLKR